ncbi:protein NUCLEAR FUSION DEFECTIVE 4-like [Amaranthus tricolor]|uniref:protein NUCLEAR FUSION DEFECTIVE 4-like n=1 Tax=Amaranthus tricolor TaxID=29722 RepID=UPI002586340E|nr:protein NUCLEAR FUSION DEFECTIVE 4-like [Amaranthus tricolor]
MGFSSEQPSMTTALKWLGFVTAVWVQAISGNNYTFSNYSDALKTLMNLTQVQLNNLSVAKDVGKAFGLLAGLASDTFPTWLLLLIGSLEGFLGYGVQWLVVSKTINPLPYWAMCIFMCMGGNSTTWMNTAILVTCIRNFRKNRGPVSGILKGYVGLSTAIFTDVCSALFADSPAKFLMMLSIVPFLVCLTAMIFLREVPPSTSESDISKESNYFNMFNIVAVVVAVYLLTHDLIGSLGHAYDVVFSVVLLALLAFPLVIPAFIAFQAWLDSKTKDDIEDQNGECTAPLLAPEGVPVSQPSQEVNGDAMANKEVVEVNGEIKKSQPVLGEEHTIVEALKTVDFWVLFVSFLCGVGTGMAVMNNMGQMGSALGYSDVSIFVSLLSIMGFFGRIISGTVSEYCIKKAATPRPLFNAASQILLAVGFVIMAMGLPGSLYLGSIIVGLCYGVRLAITVPTASELFGLKYYGLIYNILILNLPLGSFLFSGLLAGLLYDAEATVTPSGGNECYGTHCYRLCFFIMSGACLVGCALDVLMATRTKDLYAKIAASKR